MRNIAAELNAAAAKTAFVAAAWRALPQRARRQLFNIGPGKIAVWARRWHVAAPCMIQRAREYREVVATARPGDTVARDLRRGTLSIESSFGVPPVGPWQTELSRLDKLPFWLRRSLSDKVAKNYLAKYRKHDLIDDEDLLAPVAAEPLWETKAHFMERAEDHFRARQLRLQRIAKAADVTVKPPAELPQLHEHVRWLVRFQVFGESAATIAKSAGLHDPDQRVTVQKAIHELAHLIDLPSRPTRPGRPQRRTATSRM